MKLTSKTINYTVDTVAQLLLTTGTENDTVIVTDENQGGVFIYREDNASVNNGGTIFNGWTRQYDGAVNVKWFGAKGDGITDDTVAIQNAIDTGNTYIPSGVFRVSIELIVNSNNITINGNGKTSYIKSDDGLHSIIYANNKSGLEIYGLQLATITQTNATAYKGMIFLHNCRACTIKDNGIFYFGHKGIYLLDSSSCIVENNIFGESFGTIQDSADISVTGNSSFNTINSNICNGKYADHGILIQDPYTNSTPTGNIIINNQVSEHDAYGIIVYVTTDYDTKTVVSNNIVKDIRGNTGAGAFGAGIYIQSAGGTIVSNNNVSNCCLDTTNFETLGIGCISISAPTTINTVYPVVVEGNVITSTRGVGIYAATGSWDVSILNNSIVSTGTSSVRGESIKVSNVEKCKIIGNSITHTNTNYSALDFAVTAGINTTMTNISNNNIMNSASGIGLFIHRNTADSSTIKNVICNGNIITRGSGISIYVDGVDRISIDNCFTESTGAIGLYYSKSSNGRITNSHFKANGNYFVSPGSNNFVSETVRLDSGYVENNTGSGVIISQFKNQAPPQSGLWDIGSRVIQSVPAVGSPKGWRCTVAGNPGTWVSEGNL